MRVLILLIPFGLALSIPSVFAARDCLRRARHHYLPRWAWFAVIVCGWLAGAVVYYLRGRAPAVETAPESHPFPAERHA